MLIAPTSVSCFGNTFYKLGLIVLFSTNLLKRLWFFRVLWYFISIMSEETLPTTPEQKTFDNDADEALFIANAGNIARANFMDSADATESSSASSTEDSETADPNERKKALIKTAVFGTVGLAALGGTAGIAKLVVDSLDYSHDYQQKLGEDAQKAQQEFQNGLNQGKVTIDVPSDK
jgi:hypothetical protein